MSILMGRLRLGLQVFPSIDSGRPDLLDTGSLLRANDLHAGKWIPGVRGYSSGRSVSLASVALPVRGVEYLLHPLHVVDEQLIATTLAVLRPQRLQERLTEEVRVMPDPGVAQQFLAGVAAG